METEKQKEPKRLQHAHSTFRKNLSDYNDGANVSGRLGNDEEIDEHGNFFSGPEDHGNFGEVAYGNEGYVEADEENDVEDLT